MTLIENWKQAWRMVSMHCMTAAGALQGAWLSVPDDMRASVPAGLVQWLTLGLLVLGVAGRLVKQEKVTV